MGLILKSNRYRNCFVCDVHLPFTQTEMCGACEEIYFCKSCALLQYRRSCDYYPALDHVFCDIGCQYYFDGCVFPNCLERAFLQLLDIDGYYTGW